MHQLSDLANLLSLTRAESQILKVLSSTEPLRTSDVHLRLKHKFPRTTLVRHLTKLHTRGLIRKHKIGKRGGGWLSLSQTEMREHVTNIFHTDTIRTHIGSGGITVYKGRRAMLELADTAFSFHETEKVLWILSGKVWSEWRSQNLENRLARIATYFKKYSVVVEAFIPLSLSANKGADSQMFRELNERMLITHFIDDSFMNHYADVMIFRDSVSIMNWRDLFAIEIKNKDTVAFYHNIARMMREIATKNSRGGNID